MNHKTIESGITTKRNILKRFLSFPWMRKSVIVEFIALLFVILFLYTGISKLMDFMVFQEQLAESPILEPVFPVIAWGLPIIEFVASALLFFPRYRLNGLYVAFVLMILFTGYVIAILSFSKELPCSCGGIIDELSWQGHLLFNSALMALAVVGIKLSKRINQVTTK